MKNPRPTAKAINKPLQIAGVDMRMAGIALVIATVVGAVNDAFIYKVGAGVAFVAACWGARQATRTDPNLIAVWKAARSHRWLYDPAKRAVFQIRLTRNPE